MSGTFEHCDHLADEQAVFHFWQQILLAYLDRMKIYSSWISLITFVILAAKKKISLEKFFLGVAEMAKELTPLLTCQLN